MALQIQDFRKHNDLFCFVENPWSIPTANVAELRCFWFVYLDVFLDLLKEKANKKAKDLYKCWMLIE